jgi:hypothetical protein
MQYTFYYIESNEHKEWTIFPLLASNNEQGKNLDHFSQAAQKSLFNQEGQSDLMSKREISQQKSLLDTDLANYNQLLITYSQLQIQKVRVSDMLSNMQSTITSKQRLRPHTWLNTLLATVISVSALYLLALLRNWLDSSIKTTNDVAHRSKVAALGQIPFQRSCKSSAQPLDFSKEKLDPIEERTESREQLT